MRANIYTSTPTAACCTRRGNAFFELPAAGSPCCKSNTFKVKQSRTRSLCCVLAPVQPERAFISATSSFTVPPRHVLQKQHAAERMSYANLFSPSISLVLEEWFIPLASLLLSHSLPMSLPFTVQHFHSYISNEINWLEGYTMSTVLCPLNSPNCVSKTVCFRTTSFPLRNHYRLGEYTLSLHSSQSGNYNLLQYEEHLFFCFFVSSLCQSLFFACTCCECLCERLTL